MAPKPVLIETPAAQTAPVESALVQPAPTESTPTDTVELGLLLSVVAEKTGYPADVLNGGMDLETDLGIDSIKRVEIFAAVRERAAGLPPTDSPHMARLFQARTLDEVVRLMADGDEAGPAERATAAVHTNHMTQTASTDPTVVVRRLQVRPIAAPACGLAMAGLADGPISVIDGGSGLAPAVASRLTARGIAASAEERAPAPDAWGVILLGGMAPVSDPMAAAAVNRAAFQAARSVAARMSERGGVFVTVQDTGGCFGLADPDPARAWLGGLAALARTAAREWPQAAVKAIDCRRVARDDDAVADAIVDELLFGGSTLDVGLRADGTRWTVTDVAVPAFTESAAADQITADSVLVATGGGRGVTAAALLAVAAHRPRILILGRTPALDILEPANLASAYDEASLTRLLAESERAEGVTPSSPTELAARARAILARRETRATLDALERGGATVRYAAVDVTDADAVNRELARTRAQWGPITGLIHGAGVIADRLIADKTDEQFDHVYATKVEGLRVLLDATAADPVELLCVFSSVAARYGNPGQCDYAMANEVLNQVLCDERQRRPRCRIRAIGWGPWEAGMVTAAHAAHFRNRGVALIPLDAGARAFAAELRTDDDAVEVLLSAAAEGTSVATVTASRSLFAVEAAVNARTHGFLADHCPAGVPVLPLALAAEWFAAFGRAHRPDRLTALTDIRVLNRVDLPDLETGGHRFVIEGSEAAHEPGAFELRLTSPSTGITHYRARLIAPDAAPQHWSASTALFDISEVLSGEAVYNSPALFHGAAFRTLRRIEGMSREGAEAQVVGLRAAGWPDDRPWWTDPAAVDGALQAAVLWARHVTGDATLPMGVEAMRVHRAGPAPGTMRCLVRAAALAPDQTRCELALFDEDGNVRIELFGVGLVRRPDLASVHAAAAGASAGAGGAAQGGSR
jgi:NADP-dependent 3-hydroxy acid dehydrogenase YdfG